MALSCGIINFYSINSKLLRLNIKVELIMKPYLQLSVLLFLSTALAFGMVQEYKTPKVVLNSIENKTNKNLVFKVKGKDLQLPANSTIAPKANLNLTTGNAGLYSVHAINGYDLSNNKELLSLSFYIDKRNNTSTASGLLNFRQIFRVGRVNVFTIDLSSNSSDQDYYLLDLFLDGDNLEKSELDITGSITSQ